jgi:probable phosphoglycerate mutase
MHDPILFEQGIQQATRLGQRLENTKEIKADVLISSTLLCAKQTAEIIAPIFDLPIIYNKDLEEWRNADETTTPAQFEAQFKGLTESVFAQRAFFRPSPSTESWAEFTVRSCTALNSVLQEHAGKNIVVVCHGGIVESAFSLFYGFSPLQPTPIMLMCDVQYTSITYWRKISGAAIHNRVLRRLEVYNDAFHLRSDSIYNIK